MASCIFCGVDTDNIIEDKAICTDDIMLLIKSIVITIKDNPEYFAQIKNSIESIKKSGGLNS